MFSFWLEVVVAFVDCKFVRERPYLSRIQRKIQLLRIKTQRRRVSRHININCSSEFDVSCEGWSLDNEMYVGARLVRQLTVLEERDSGGSRGFYRLSGD